MSMRECPECDSSVKLENMKRHYANVHPGRDPSAAISDEEHREVRRAAKVGGSSLTARRVAVVLALVALVVGVGYLGLPYILGSHSNPNFDVVTYCGVEGSVEHYHPLLVINDNGAAQHLPYDSSQGADIGAINQAGYTNPAYYCASGQFHVLHTHDGSGIIHVELPQVVNPAPTLGDFFTIWGEPLNPSAAWTFSGHVTATVYNSDTHSVTDFSSNLASIPLYEPAGGPTANEYPIPQGLIFNGAYGDGQSGGTFSGEIIWLNVTA
ncbi:MAG TPA: hypothetical protein VEY12_09860 [Thermoplasmata archaeon]|nr:hypothetical protein [Thermoplasmata archaeon]